VVANGVIYAGPDAIDAATGVVLWDNPTGTVASSPAVVNGMVYIGSEDANVYAFGLPGN
jgi:outer membrane protein assembly factor BamB